MSFLKYLIPIFFFFFHSLHSQVISGTVYDKYTNKVLPGATVYLDGTTIGVISNLDGKFEFRVKNSLNSNLIISHLGYLTASISPTNFESSMVIYLDENREQLEEIVLEPDDWSRAKKLRIFKSEFLGKNTESQYCEILNEKDITLIYSKSKNQLIAICENPIQIKNKYLSYEIYYNLADFEAEFALDPNGWRYTKQVYIAGTSFFKDLSIKTKKKIFKRRVNEYKGSLVHFMRSLANQKLSENEFDIYYKSLKTASYKYFNLSKENNQTKVTLLAAKLSVLYNQDQQSSIEFTSSDFKFFYIDAYGNHSPPNSLLFGGDFGVKRMANLMPLDYVFEDSLSTK